MLNKIKEINISKLVTIIVILGIIIRIVYIAYTPYNTRQHDLGTIESSYGHIGYILYISENLSLPDSNTEQYYQPPLHHIISGMFLKFETSILNFSTETALEGVQLLTCIYSIIIIIVSYKILKELNLSKKAIIFGTSIIAFHPTLIILAGSINNDILSIMFIFITILYLIKWYKNPNIKNIFFMGLALGLGMMTKISCAALAPIIGIIFLIRWFKYKKPFKQFFMYKQFFIFGIASIPLGLWYSIRNLIKFEQSLGYVLKISTESDLYVGNYSIYERFLKLPLNIIGDFKYINTTTDYNIIEAILKSSMFGEYGFNTVKTLSIVLLIANIVLVILSLISMIYVLIKDKDKENKIFNYMFLGLWVIQILSFIMVNIKYPFGCTMDFRYLIPTLLVGIYFIAKSLDLIKNKYIKGIYYITISLFVLLSICFFVSQV